MVRYRSSSNATICAFDAVKVSIPTTTINASFVNYRRGNLQHPVHQYRILWI